MVLQHLCTLSLIHCIPQSLQHSRGTLTVNPLAYEPTLFSSARKNTCKHTLETRMHISYFLLKKDYTMQNTVACTGRHSLKSPFISWVSWGEDQIFNALELHINPVSDIDALNCVFQKEHKSYSLKRYMINWKDGPSQFKNLQWKEVKCCIAT